MDSLRDTMARWRAFVDGFPGFLDRTSTVLALDAKEMVNTRVVETGTDANGQKLVNAKSGKEYSDREIPTSVFVDAGTISASQAKQLPVKASYVDVKKLLGRYRGKRDLTFTGRMWKNTGLKSKTVSKGGFVATVAGQNAETQMKLDKNSATSGVDVLQLSKTETEELSATLDGELQLYMDQHLS